MSLSWRMLMTLWSEKESSESFFFKRKDSAERFVGKFGIVFALTGMVAVAALVAWAMGLI